MQMKSNDKCSFHMARASGTVQYTIMHGPRMGGASIDSATCNSIGTAMDLTKEEIKGRVFPMTWYNYVATIKDPSVRAANLKLLEAYKEQLKNIWHRLLFVLDWSKFDQYKQEIIELVASKHDRDVALNILPDRTISFAACILMGLDELTSVFDYDTNELRGSMLYQLNYMLELYRGPQHMQQLNATTVLRCPIITTKEMNVSVTMEAMFGICEQRALTGLDKADKDLIEDWHLNDLIFKMSIADDQKLKPGNIPALCVYGCIMHKLWELTGKQIGGKMACKRPTFFNTLKTHNLIPFEPGRNTIRHKKSVYVYAFKLKECEDWMKRVNSNQAKAADEHKELSQPEKKSNNDKREQSEEMSNEDLRNLINFDENEERAMMDNFFNHNIHPNTAGSETTDNRKKAASSDRQCNESKKRPLILSPKAKPVAANKKRKRIKLVRRKNRQTKVCDDSKRNMEADGDSSEGVY